MISNLFNQVADSGNESVESDDEFQICNICNLEGVYLLLYFT